MKALVTGGGGFLGRYIVEQLLERGDSVRTFARGEYPALARLGVEVVRGNIQDGEAVRKACSAMDCVFHAAAHPGIWGPWESFYQPNVVGTENMIAACRIEKVPKFVFTSSPSVVFNNQDQRGCDESLPYPEKYENYYSHSKALAEQMVLDANGDGVLTVALRPHLIWGPRDPHLLPRLIERAGSGQLMQVGDGTNRVDITYVEDAARAHLLAADALEPGTPAAGSVYFISQDAPVNLWQWIHALLDQLDIPPIRRRISLSTARTIGAIMEFGYRLLRMSAEPRMTRFLATELAKDHYYDISRAKQELGYQPQFTMAAALEKTLPFLR
ncbi:3-beta hydroxysteroid dehydrogenase [candidate division KSB3 bacterium]|uniref:3-beta hydroxysteroid dehydrogenase n=1 Tax=candidate division KSB3 bacterium TaxID=2044937 RepID=A0A2G6E0J4_9BACT|nr:MAG: 3-beta hydroxysteroid dehydrogenase [candidate division KSB3 bacterium]PIE28337.1 MAG: 3-beta hydroxysteroid dehydrogenase [candidate division KSB3 bacterium]